MAYLSEADIEAFMGNEVQEALFSDDANDVFLAALIADADAIVDAALASAGYTVPMTGTVPRIVKIASFGQFVRLAYARKNLTVPLEYAPALNTADNVGSIAAAMRTGEVPVPGVVDRVASRWSSGEASKSFG